MPEEAQTESLIAFITCPPSLGPELAKALVEESLAACVNIVPAVQSVYKWQGELQSESESLLIAKTNRVSWESFCARVKALHPYEVPEIICVAVQNGYEPYIKWLESSLRIVN